MPLTHAACSPTEALRERTAGMKKLLFVTNAGGFGGAEIHLLELIERLRQSDVQLSILQVGADIYPVHLREHECPHVEVHSQKIRNSLGDWFRYFRKRRPDTVVFVNSWIRSYPWYSSLAAYLAGVPRRFAIQHLIAEPLQKVEGSSIRNVLRRLFGGRTRTRLISSVSAFFCTTTICVSNAVRNRLVDDYRYPANKTVTIYNGASVSEFVPSTINRTYVRTRLGIAPEEFVLVCVARLDEVKGHDILLSALARLLSQGQCCKCIIVGDGPLRKSLGQQVHALGLNGSVFFEGFQKDVRSFLQAADAFVLTSHAEGFPLSIVEAMSCGLPCIVTDVGGNAEAVHHMAQGLIVAPRSVEGVANAIAYLLAHPRKRVEMSEMARERALKEFDIQDRMADIIRVILN
jgi:glycosyltransferase involved in cell wall biosynthesis